METGKKKRLLIAFAISFLIALQLGRIIYVFMIEREGYHSDENWSYGFANSYFEPDIYKNEDGGLTNFNTWTSGQVLRDYLVVNKGEGFSYGSVYYNQKKDFSPPLYSMILHTVCSFFPETFSWWYAFSINIAVFVLTIIALYFLGVRITKSRWAGLALCLFYGFSTGALNTFVYLRMYALLTLLAVLSAYLHSRMYDKRFDHTGKELVLLILTTSIGALTHYYFIVLSFFLAFCFCIYLLFGKRWKALLSYAGGMLLSMGLVLAIYPFAISNAEYVSTAYIQMPYLWRLRECFYILFGELTGITVYPYLPQLLLFCYGVLLLLAFAAPLCFLFRKEPWFLKAAAAVGRFPKRLAGRMREMNLAVVFLFFSVMATLAIIAGISNILLMGILTDRYLFFLMPLFGAVLVRCLDSILKSIPIRQLYRQSLLITFCIVLLFVNNYNTTCHYLFSRNSTAATIENLTNGANCILVTNESWLLTYYASRLINTDHFFAMLTTECMEHGQELEKLDSSKPVYLIVENLYFPDEDGKLAEGYDYFTSYLDYTEKEFLEYLIGLDNIEDAEYVSTEDSFAGELDIYRIYMN